MFGFPRRLPDSEQSAERRFLLYLLVAVVAVKAVLLAIDPTPSLFMGDSGSYFNTALYGAIPGDRSFVYGFFLRACAVWPHSLLSLVLAQAALSAISAWLVAFCLIRYFQASFTAAAVCSMLCSIEPLQLLAERYVLTESLALFLFAIFMVTCFHYLTRGGLLWLGFAQVLGVCLVSIRISFLPMVLFASAGLPFMNRQTASFIRRTVSTGTVRFTRVSLNRANWSLLTRLIVVPLLFSLGVSQIFLLGYRHLYGYLIEPPMHGHPAYFYRDGLFLASDFAPLIKPSDYPIPGQRAAVFGTVKVPLGDPRARDAQRWSPDGLSGRIIAQFGGDEYRADPVARKTALRALKHHPLELIELTAKTFAEYFDESYLAGTLATDEGIDRKLDPPLIVEYKKDFDEDFSHTRPNSFTKRWHRKLFFWYEFLLLLPFLLWVFLAWNWSELNSCYWFSAILLVAFLEGATVTVTRPTARFLTAMAWLSITVLGGSCSHVARRWHRRGGRFRALKFVSYTKATDCS